jgi:hypothetical protein
MVMERKIKINSGVNSVKFSLDELQDVIGEGGCSTDSLARLTNALQDINEEVNMLRTIIQINSKR